MLAFLLLFHIQLVEKQSLPVFLLYLCFVNHPLSYVVCNLGFLPLNQNKTRIYWAIFLNDQCHIRSHSKFSGAITIPFDLISSPNVINVSLIPSPMFGFLFSAFLPPFSFKIKKQPLFSKKYPSKKQNKLQPYIFISCHVH